MPLGPASPRRPLLFFLFFVSGFCGLVYQIVWTRLAFASFGIITPVLSVVISVFMLGLSLGSWAGGRWVGALSAPTRLSPVTLYGLTELVIGCGAFGVPVLFAFGERLLLPAGESNSLIYLLCSALVLAASILPWCICMGATFPFMMAYLRATEPDPKSFSFLYLANVLGAVTGTILSAVALVELFGFTQTLHLAALGNFLIAFISFRLGKRTQPSEGDASRSTLTLPITPHALRSTINVPPSLTKTILFTTGFVSMAAEVVWTREFAPVLKTQVYSFALVVAAYLAATFLGSLLYRRHAARNRSWHVAILLPVICVAGVLPLFVAELCFPMQTIEQPYAAPTAALLLLAGIAPFCALLGYLTPALIDDFAAGSPTEAGSAYALNILGCIVGPLFASYVLLPNLSERNAILLLALPLFALSLFSLRRSLRRPRLGFGVTAASAAVLIAALLFTHGFEEYLARGARNLAVRRDYAASVVSFGEGMEKRLLVNGNSMTKLTPVTKFMAHLPLALHRGKPRSALLICFGMGTTYRSALSWDVQTTAVELIPGVKGAFPFYYADAPEALRNPNGSIIVDDGRRYLKRTRAKFDVIIIDPPPPVEAAGSSLLYSTEFYQLARRRLNPGGIIQAWVPYDLLVACAALRSFRESFPYVRCFPSIKGWGLHMLGSLQPIDTPAKELPLRFPDTAKRDLLEWAPGETLPDYLAQVTSRETGTNDILRVNPYIRITDDDPYNEYFLLRTWLSAH